MVPKTMPDTFYCKIVGIIINGKSLSPAFGRVSNPSKNLTNITWEQKIFKQFQLPNLSINHFAHNIHYSISFTHGKLINPSEVWKEETVMWRGGGRLFLKRKKKKTLFQKGRPWNRSFTIQHNCRKNIE